MILVGKLGNEALNYFYWVRPVSKQIVTGLSLRECKNPDFYTDPIIMDRRFE
jgi:hypothetical protein